MDMPLKAIWKLQLVQNEATCMLALETYYSHITLGYYPSAVMLPLLPIGFQVFQVLKPADLAPGYLQLHLLIPLVYFLNL